MVVSEYTFQPDTISEDDGFRKYDRGVEAYKDVEVLQGPKCHVDGIRSYGSDSSGVVFVGISPARDETTRTRRPLTGPSGQLLDACLEAIEQKRENVYCTNVVCTWMDNPSLDDINECRKRLDYELQILKPKLIVLLGKIVAEYFTGRTFGKVRGAVQWSSEYNCYIMATYHPSAILQSMGDYGSSKDDKASGFIADFIRDLRKIPQVLEWEPNAPESRVRYRVVNSIEQAQNVLDNLPRSSDFPIALDVETNHGKDDDQVEVFEDELLCVGVGSDNYCWVFTPTSLYNEDGTPALVWPNDIWWVMHNAIFDSGVMKRRLGVWINICEDTMLQSYSLDERAGVHRLKSLAREYLAVGFYEDDRFYGKMKLYEISTDLLYEYNAKDVVYTARLCKKFREWQEQDNVREFYKRLLIRPLNVYKEAQYHGVNIDMNVHLKFTWEWGNQIVQLDQELQQMAQDEGWEGFLNLQSPDQLGQFIFKILSLPCEKYTRGGKPSVDKEVIEKLRTQHEFIPKLEAIRRLYKMWGTYIVSLPEKLKVDGRAHPVVKLHGQTGGRPSYGDLAIQTFVAPSVPTQFNTLRELIIAPPYTGYEGTDGYIPPPDDEYVIVEVDYGKAELWVAQSYSEDTQMLADLLSGDYHRRVAGDIFEKELDKVTGDDRTIAKRTSFGILYGIEDYGLAALIKRSVFEAKDWIKRWFARNTGYYKWFTETQKEIKRTGELVSKTGRKRRIIILGNASRAVRQAVNFPVQSTSNDVVLDSIVEMHPKLKAIGSHILFTMHDSIITKCLKSRLQEHCQIMHDIMIAPHFEGVRQIPVEIKIAKSWGKVKGIHDCAEESTKPNEYGIDLETDCAWRTYAEQLKQEIA